jgi:hypothetical protein
MMSEIISTGESRRDCRKPHPLFEEMRRDGVIFSVT